MDYDYAAWFFKVFGGETPKTFNQKNYPKLYFHI